MNWNGIRRTLCGLIVAATATISANQAAADHIVKPGPVKTVTHNLNPTNWRMPKWKMPKFGSILPQKEEKARIVKKKESLFDEVKTTTANTWNRTKEALNPQKLNPARMFPASAKLPSKPKKKEPGFWSNLLAPYPPQQETSDQTMTDFLGLDKPN